MKNKKFMLGIIVGIILTSTAGYAAYKYQATDVGYTPDNSEFKVDNVSDAIKELYKKCVKTYTVYTNGQAIYYNPVTNEKCSESEATQNYTTNGVTGTKTGCMKWYTFNDEGKNASKVNMILDHNTTAIQQWYGSNTNVAYENSLVKPVADKLVSESGWKVTPRLITAGEISTIIGGTNFDLLETEGYFYLDSLSLTKTANATNKSKYAWLFDYTNSCIASGCNIADGSTWGYWTATPYGDVGKSTDVLNVHLEGDFQHAPATWNYRGVRPVITIPKNIIK